MCFWTDILCSNSGCLKTVSHMLHMCIHIYAIQLCATVVLNRKASYDHNTICMQSSSSFTLSVLCIVCSQLRKSAMGVHGNLWAASKISGHSLQEPCIWPYQRSRGTLLAGHRTLRYSYIFLAEAKSQIVPPRRGSLQHSIHSRDICHTSAIIPVAALCTMRRLGPYDSQSDFFGIPLSCRRLHRCLLNAPVLVLVSSRIPECIHEGAQPLPCAPPP